MMPLSPSPSLKFRTARFPRYGFKADISDGAFPSSALLKLAPSIRSPMFGLLPSFAPLESQTLLPVLSRAGFPLRDTVTRASRPYPRGPRSGQGYSVPVHQHLLTSSDPLTSTPRFPSYAGYTESLCCAGAPSRLPMSGSELSLLILVSMQPSMTTENPPVAYTQFLHRRHSLHLRKKDSAFSSIPPQSATSGTAFSWLTVRSVRYSLLTR